MILWKMRHPARHLKRNCRKSHRQQLKRETEVILLQAIQSNDGEFEESFSSLEEENWYLEALDYKEQMRQEHEDEMYEQDMATDDYRFRYRLGEYDSWNDGEELGDYY